MKAKIDSDKGKETITRCFATVEPVFGNIRDNKRQVTNMSGLGRMSFLEELAYSTAELVEKNLAGQNQEVQNRPFLQRF